jgi:TolB-like protein/Tfp pilus assembly protein PilF
VKVWQELRRRRVFRLAGLYIFGAWALIQVADISFPAWGLPETALRYLFVAAIAGFPVALVFSWFYDITPQGIIRTEPAGAAEAVDLRLKRVDYIVLAALLAIGVSIVLGSVGKIQEEIETGTGVAARAEKQAHSIAVLPFANLDTRPDTGYFSDGVTEEILHRLSTMGALHVLASTSSFAFRGSDETPASISDKLGVRYLLQGSVRRDGDYVRVTARLLDESGFQVWSDRFDRKLESIFVIQSEIASKVSGEVLNEIVPPQELPEGRTTENMEAYNAFLKGRAYFDSRIGNWKQEAKAAFDRAIELDPGYAPPYAGKATLVVNSDRGPHWEEARNSALKSLELDPDLALGHATLGLSLAVLGEYERGIESLHRALELDPSLAIAYTWITMPLNELGRHDEARAMNERGLEVDPLSPVLLRNAAGNASFEGNYDRAEQLLLRLTGLPEPPGWTYMDLWQLYDEWGQYAEALAAAKSLVRQRPDGNLADSIELIIASYASLGLEDEVAYWDGVFGELWSVSHPPLHLTWELAMRGVRLDSLAPDLEHAERVLPKVGLDEKAYILAYGGLAWTYTGNPAKAMDWLEKGIAIYQQAYAPAAPPDSIDYELLMHNWRIQLVRTLARRVAFACDSIGDSRKAEKAMRFLERQHAIQSDDTNPAEFEHRALVRVLAGDTTASLELLRQASKLGWANYYGIVNDPAWAETLELPHFQAVLAEAKANNDRQRAIVEAAEAEQHFRAEFEQLLSTQSQRSP